MSVQRYRSLSKVLWSCASFRLGTKVSRAVRVTVLAATSRRASCCAYSDFQIGNVFNFDKVQCIDFFLLLWLFSFFFFVCLRNVCLHQGHKDWVRMVSSSDSRVSVRLRPIFSQTSCAWSRVEIRSVSMKTSVPSWLLCSAPPIFLSL